MLLFSYSKLMLTLRIFFSSYTLTYLPNLTRTIESPLAFSFTLVIEIHYFSALSLLLFVKDRFYKLIISYWVIL
jgi:hypothetical protein